MEKSTAHFFGFRRYTSKYLRIWALTFMYKCGIILLSVRGAMATPNNKGRMKGKRKNEYLGF